MNSNIISMYWIRIVPVHKLHQVDVRKEIDQCHMCRLAWWTIIVHNI